MKRYGHLWSQIICFANLLQAAKQAQRGKRFRNDILKFNANLEIELLQLQTELQTKNYIPGQYKTFEIVEPKRRLISAAPYRDRVVHHAVCNIIVPLLERSFIADSYANRKGFGTHRALRRFTQFTRSSTYILQCDIQKYFPSIDHAILKTLLRRKLKCPDTLWLLETILDHSNPQESLIHYFPGDDLLTPAERRRGLPIGNLTSQFFANLYLNGFDHFVQEQLKISKYLRYVDDFALFGEDKTQLQHARTEIEHYLATLRLKIHPVKSQLFKTHKGPTFLGFRILPQQIRVRTDNLRRAKKRLRKQQQDYLTHKIPLETLSQSIYSWIAHLEHGDTWQLRKKLFSHLTFTKESTKILSGQALPTAAGRLLEQQSD